MNVTKSILLFVAIILLPSFCSAQDRDLHYYLGQGLANSPLLKDFDNEVAANSVDSERLHATFKPQVTGIANNSVAPVIGGWGYDAAISNIFAVSDMVNVNQAFIGRQNLSAQNKGYSLLSDSLRHARKMSEQDLKRSITAQYIVAWGDWQQLNFYKEVYATLSGQGDILKRLTEANVYRQTDYLTFLVTLRQQQLQVKQCQIQYRSDFATLNYLCGLFDTSAVSLAEPEISLDQLPDPSASVFFYHFVTDSIRFANSLSVLNYSYRPRLSAFANAGYSSSFIYEAYKNFGFSVGMNLSVPIYDGHQRALQQRRIKLQAQTTSAYRDYFKDQYAQQIAMLRQQLAATESLIADINDQVKYAGGLIDANSRLLEVGEAKIADLVIALGNYLTARNLLTQNNVSRMQIINQINYWNR